MKQKVLSILLPLACALCVFVFTQAVWHSTQPPIQETVVEERIHLALREAVHQLRLAAGDSTSAILPARKESAGRYRVELNRNIEYSHLKGVLSATFQRHQLEYEYRVSVLECSTNALMLGFISYPADTSTAYPCQEREQLSDCYNLVVTFPALERSSTAAPPIYWQSIFAVCFALGGYVLARYFPLGKPKAPISEERIPANTFHFDLENQVVIVQGTAHQLTFQEAQLLHFFYMNPNTVLSRDQILAAVWGDEGLKITRTLDVFVSRLRKILQADENISISTVHGVGYRLDVNTTLLPKPRFSEIRNYQN